MERTLDAGKRHIVTIAIRGTVSTINSLNSFAGSLLFSLQNSGSRRHSAKGRQTFPISSWSGASFGVFQSGGLLIDHPARGTRPEGGCSFVMKKAS
jgi:hypothetical protein